MSDNQMGKFLADIKKEEFKETLGVLDALRKARKARGGVGAPLEVPAHFKETRLIVVTDEDLKKDSNIPLNNG